MEQVSEWEKRVMPVEWSSRLDGSLDLRCKLNSSRPATSTQYQPNNAVQEAQHLWPPSSVLRCKLKHQLCPASSIFAQLIKAMWTLQEDPGKQAATEGCLSRPCQLATGREREYPCSLATRGFIDKIPADHIRQVPLSLWKAICMPTSLAYHMHASC